MRYQFLLALSLALLASCVSAKKFKALEAKEKACSDALAKAQLSSSDFESKWKDTKGKWEANTKEVVQLKKDTAVLGDDKRTMNQAYAQLKNDYDQLEASYNKYKNLGSKEMSSLQNQLEQKSNELQKKSEELVALEGELKAKQALLEEREQKVNELQELLDRQENALKSLKKRVTDALIGFENKGLKIEQKNGKIYVSMDAKLLFKSGSIVVESEGKSALLQIGKALENEKELEIVVEGHTDTDKLSSPTFPRNNWELSVLRATSVVQILLANSAMNPERIVAAGRSEYQPVDPSDKAKNRRIEIIISPNLNALFDLISN